MQRDLAPGEVLRVDTGCIVGFQPSVDYDIQYVGKIKSALFGGEGLFFATLRGPGRVWLQSLPLSRLADRIIAAARPVFQLHKVAERIAVEHPDVEHDFPPEMREKAYAWLERFLK